MNIRFLFEFFAIALHNVEFGDLLGFVDSLQSALQDFENNTNLFTQKLINNAIQIRANYSLEREQETCLDVWTKIIERNKK